MIRQTHRWPGGPLPPPAANHFSAWTVGVFVGCWLRYSKCTHTPPCRRQLQICAGLFYFLNTVGTGNVSHLTAAHIAERPASAVGAHPRGAWRTPAPSAGQQHMQQQQWAEPLQQTSHNWHHALREELTRPGPFIALSEPEPTRCVVRADEARTDPTRRPPQVTGATPPRGAF